MAADQTKKAIFHLGLGAGLINERDLFGKISQFQIGDRVKRRAITQSLLILVAVVLNSNVKGVN
ncbi:MAG: hypothetical protein JO235_26615 [Chroococcidiopsidaceae cyanobacterium CP_BM_RX_35]|nr:hypothetical protein [Chroococcidiopsidaceae cyanobacterium CP_BM_RX_35]